jgi:hypothetical protein
METTYAPTRRSLPPVPRAVDDPQLQQDAAQAFVARLRAAAVDFAAAAGARTAVVTEAVPPARHRRSRCRVVLRDVAGAETDVTFLGPAGSPGTVLRRAFDVQIQRWLAYGGPRDPRWLLADADSAGGVAVDLPAWAAGA